MKTFILVGFGLWIIRQKWGKKYRSMFPGIEEYVVGISTLIWAVLEWIFHERGLQSKRWFTELRFGDLSSTTVLKMIGFVFIFLPFVAGLFHFAFSSLFLFLIPLSSLIICIANGLYPVPGFLFLILSTALISLCVLMLYWMMVASFRIYSWLLQANLWLIIFIMLALVVAGMLDRDVVSDRWLSNS